MNRTLAFLALSLAPAPAWAIDSTFTYQGSLTDGGQPANGSYDLHFALFDNRQFAVGSPLALEDVAVSNGVFTVVLDFGPTAFTGPDRFLQIGVRPGNATRPHTLLTPNTAVRPAPYSQLAADALFAASVDDNTISTAKIVDGAVGTADLSANAVTSAKIADGSVVPADISPNSITGATIAADTIFSGNIGASAVGASELANNAVTSIKIADLSITDDDIAGNTIASSSILDGTIAAADIANGAVNSAKIADDSITDFDIAQSTITGQSILDGTISSFDIGVDAVGSSEIANGSIVSGDIAVNTIVGANIASQTITDLDIAGNTITGGSVLNGTLTASDVAANTFWQAGGNAGTTPGTHFIGTTDGKALQIKAGAVSIAASNGAITGARALEVISDTANLAVFRTPNLERAIYFTGSTGPSDAAITFIANDVNGGALRFLDDDFHVGLELVVGGSKLALDDVYGGGTVLSLRDLGTASVTAEKPGGGPWSAPSDQRLKHDVQPLNDALDRLLQLRGVTFEYNDVTSGKYPAGIQTGFVAQEVQQVFPSWVDKGADGYLLVGSKGFEALAVEALRELRAEKDQELSAALAAIAELRGENAGMRKRLSALEATPR